MNTYIGSLKIVNDALLLIFGDELMSVGQWEAVPDEPGVYRLEVLRGRRGTCVG